MDSDSLVATRAKRANAGSRLRQLIELEEQQTSVRLVGQMLTEDDENVNLLFQEDDNDGEFEGSGSEEEGEDQANDSETANDDGEENKADESEADNVDPDEVLSDSDLSDSDTDEEEGERELQKQEKIKKRKKKSLIPEIKRVRVDKPKPKTKTILAETLLLSSRRLSSRSSAVESKQALLEKLKEDEKRRAQLTPVVRVKEREMTQEERLAEAVETEKANIESLNAFREQEIVKNEYRKNLLALRRERLVHVIRYITKETYISPEDEVNHARYMYEMELERLRRRPGRRRKLGPEELLRFRLPGDVDQLLPYYRAEMEELRKKEEAEAAALAKAKAERDAEKARLKVEREVARAKAKAIRDAARAEATRRKELAKRADAGDEEARAQLDELAGEEKEPEDDESKGDVEVDAEVGEQKEAAPSLAMEVDESVEKLKEVPNQDGNLKEEKEEPGETNETDALVDAPADTDLKDDPERHVTFADDPKSVKEESPTPEIEEPQEVFQGPVQKTTQNALVFVECDDLRLMEYDMKSYLFGKSVHWPPSRRFRDTKTIARIGHVENPYAVIKEERDEALVPASEITEEDPIFEELKRIPRLGVAQEYLDDDNAEQEMAIRIRTEAPTGLYLPNNNKKNCSVTGAEVRYFDFNLGIPYSTQEALKVIKLVEQGQVPYYNIPPEVNSWGPAEVFVGSREGQRHARGVPEGFDGTEAVSAERSVN